MYVTPQTDDGLITRRIGRNDDSIEVEAQFSLSPALHSLASGRESSFIFAARSRLARLGINITPLAPLRFDGPNCTLRLAVVAAIHAYGIEAHLDALIQPGLRVGRLVFCPDESRLDSAAINALIRNNEIQVPASFSLGANGYLMIRPQQQVFCFPRPLTPQEITAIVTFNDGKDVLNRLQIRTPVERIELPPNDGLVTACSMFLHRHYVVLQNIDDALGFHLQATVLDPVSTRGTNIYLEFINRSEHLIVNPSVAATVHEAIRREEPCHYWYGTGSDRTGDAVSDYECLRRVFDDLEQSVASGSGAHRLMAATTRPAVLFGEARPEYLCARPDKPELPHPPQANGDMPDLAARPMTAVWSPDMLAEIPAGAGATLLLGYFPNMMEHIDICAAAQQGKIARIAFRRGAYEHGPFLSERDHGRLADYEGLGIEVYWCNDERGHVARHSYRGDRGYFVAPHQSDRFRSALVFAFYGSIKPLGDAETIKIERLINNLTGLFGNDIAVLTGGGPGAMQQVTDIAHRLQLLVGSSFIETADQETNKSADFYQTFQSRSRQSRQRWFEIASFHIFLVGGVGTLEEIGLTLTDIKLGVMEASPIVFLDGTSDGLYWDGLRSQFKRMVREHRAPQWLLDNILMTADPDEVPRFYRKVLRLG